MNEPTRNFFNYCGHLSRNFVEVGNKVALFYRVCDALNAAMLEVEEKRSIARTPMEAKHAMKSSLAAAIDERMPEPEVGDALSDMLVNNLAYQQQVERVEKLSAIAQSAFAKLWVFVIGADKAVAEFEQSKQFNHGEVALSILASKLEDVKNKKKTAEEALKFAETLPKYLPAAFERTCSVEAIRKEAAAATARATNNKEFLKKQANMLASLEKAQKLAAEMSAEETNEAVADFMAKAKQYADLQRQALLAKHGFRRLPDVLRMVRAFFLDAGLEEEQLTSLGLGQQDVAIAMAYI